MVRLVGLCGEGIFQESPAPSTLSGEENALGEPRPGTGPLETKNLFLQPFDYINIQIKI